MPGNLLIPLVVILVVWGGAVEGGGNKLPVTDVKELTVSKAEAAAAAVIAAERSPLNVSWVPLFEGVTMGTRGGGAEEGTVESVLLSAGSNLKWQRWNGLLKTSVK